MRAADQNHVLESVLIVLGAILEGSGFWLTWRDLRQAEDAVVDYLRPKPVVIETDHAYLGAVFHGVEVEAKGAEPPIEEQVQRLREELARERADRQKENELLRARLEEHIARGDRRVSEANRERFENLERLVTRRSRWKLPQILFVLGVACSTLGALI